jgi:putative NADPH-quinone reductase
MARRIAVIQGHPDPDPARLCRALGDAYAEGAQAGGHVVDRIDLARLDFQLLRDQQAFEHGEVPDVLRPASEAVRSADHLVIIFPLWLGTMPALVKGFLEQVMRPGVAFEYQAKGFPKKLFKGKSARLVVTMGMPAFAYRWLYMAHGLKGLERSILGFVGIGPIRETLFGGVGAATEEKRKSWLEKMRQLGAAGR